MYFKRNIPYNLYKVVSLTLNVLPEGRTEVQMSKKNVSQEMSTYLTGVGKKAGTPRTPQTNMYNW